MVTMKRWYSEKGEKAEIVSRDGQGIVKDDEGEGNSH